MTSLLDSETLKFDFSKNLCALKQACIKLAVLLPGNRYQTTTELL